MLYDKVSMAVKYAVSKEAHRLALTAVCFQKDRTVASNGAIAAIVENPTVDLEKVAWDVKPNFVQDVLIPGNRIKDIERIIPKTNRPELNHVSLSDREFRANDLESKQSFSMRDMEAQFPDVDAVIPNGKPDAMANLSVANLERIIKVMKSAEIENVTIEFRQPIDKRPQALIIRSERGRKVTGIIMPVVLKK